MVRQFPDASFVSISEHQRLPLPEANWCHTIQHGLPVDLFRPSYGSGSYLAFLGRLTAEKGPEDAIRIARAAGRPLRIAAKIPRAETAYFKKNLKPHVDGEKVQLVGEVDDARTPPMTLTAGTAHNSNTGIVGPPFHLHFGSSRHRPGRNPYVRCRPSWS